MDIKIDIDCEKEYAKYKEYLSACLQMPKVNDKEIEKLLEDIIRCSYRLELSEQKLGTK